MTICGENEKDPEAQARADQGHQRQAEKAGEITEGEIQLWTPPPQAKDLAELNELQQTEAAQNQQKMQEMQHKKPGSGAGPLPRYG